MKLVDVHCHLNDSRETLFLEVLDIRSLYPY